MTPMRYARAIDAQDAVLQATTGAQYLGGGTNLVDLMRETIERPEGLVDVSGLAVGIEEADHGGLMIGAGTRNTAIAAHALVRQRYPVLARAILAGASAQIRNMATAGGNLLQRTRCAYFYDESGSRCNKRHVGQGCDALEGFNRNHSILGASDACIAVHPSDMAVALASLDAVVHTRTSKGERQIALTELHRLPGDRPDIETVLEPGELITGISLPPALPRSTYRKVRDRSSYAFALASVAGAIDVADGHVRDVRLALGGVAPRPWRAYHAEDVLRGGPIGKVAFAAAADAELSHARALRDNGFKIELARRTIVAVLEELTGEPA